MPGSNPSIVTDTEHIRFMARALKLARQGLYTTDPNPRVGCVLVKDGVIVGEGFHARAGGAHAEVNALERAGKASQGATAYVTLEPCCHSGRTGPCTHRLIEAGVRRVFVALRDPNPAVRGNGIAALGSAGIEVHEGLLGADAAALNKGFIHRMSAGRPYVRVKLAMSLDARTALKSGESHWITSPEARRDVQRLRARSSAILTGAATVLADDPRLDVRESFAVSATPRPKEIRQPLRIIVDSNLRTPPGARILSPPGSALIATLDPEGAKANALRAAGAEVAGFPAEDGRVDLVVLLDRLARREVNELHVECGATLAGALLAARLVDELVLYVAPVMLGADARPLAIVGDVIRMDQRLELCFEEIRPVGPDLRVTARPRAKE